MASLTDTDVEKLFSGAPQYFARSEGHFTGAPHPSVAFPWDEQLEIRDLTDHTQIEDRAWSCVTAWPHITRDVQPDRSTAQKMTAAKRRAHFYPRCRERPNMLSMSGLEKGSVGYQAALELGVSDALQEEQYGFETLGATSPVVVEQRQKMLASREGLRHLDDHAILEQLIRSGRRYSEQHHRTRRESSELYNELFLHILHPPTKVLDHGNPYSLSVQIHALVKVLATPNMWIDFSHVEWRIRLGQLLWGAEEEVEPGDTASIRSGNPAVELHEERYWLLLQILLASELLVRLDAITEGEELGIESIKPSEIHRFEREANRSVKWSLHLARAWLENIEVVRAEKKELQAEQKPIGWLATLTKRMSLSHDSNNHSNYHLSHHHGHPAYVYAIKGRHCERQVDGLKHFARQLKWPDIDSYAARISENCRALTDGTPLTTPLATPASHTTNRSSYFGDAKEAAAAETSGSSSKHQPARRRQIQAALNPQGWLSKSYVSGLMLPGEALCHLLMSTLLENDQEAMARLGPMANLCGGFMYAGKSFWSTACIVGRVLAAGKGSAECMGWISSDITPQNIGDSWVNIEVDPVPAEDAEHINKKARLWFKAQIERDSHVLGDADPSMVLPADFIIPHENVYAEPPPTLWIDLKALNLYVPVDSVHTTPTEETPAPTPLSEAPTTTSTTAAAEIKTYPAALDFKVGSEDALGNVTEKEYTFVLAKDVYFVTAHPCVPSQHVRIMKSATSPTIQQINLSGSGPGTPGTPSTPGHSSRASHPLHKSYTHTTLHLSALLSHPSSTSLASLLSSSSPSSSIPIPTSTFSPLPPTSSSRPPPTPAKFLIIDCITNFPALPQEHEIPLSPTVSRTSSLSVSSTDVPLSPVRGRNENYEEAGKKMHHETRRRQFGSDMEVLVRAICAERGWNAVVSRRRRGCLACAVREAGALGWRVVVRVD
ncbi:hypothetical protein GE09DRAFT_960885 [Coniochaeta sp. 2T2.1]|nr:hypothetical protein GE09DRAFT_960885 [Coniochaeta sp. 2T2.1]